MNLQWKKAELNDLEELVATRVMVLRAANLLDDDADMGQVEEASRAYYQHALPKGTHEAWLVMDQDQVVATGGVSYSQVMPTYHNPSGWKAYIMNMYTAPAYRRQGIARETLRRLVEGCKARGISHIALEATQAGRPLYTRYGFVPMQDEMILPEDLL